MTHSPLPSVLCFSGSDSFGAAGAQADLKTINRFGCYATQVITAVTAQSADTCFAVSPTTAQDLSDQVAAIRKGLTPSAVKIGMLGSREALKIIKATVKDLDVPVVLDPVLSSSSGQLLSGGNSSEDFYSLAAACPLMMTPNTLEAEHLTGISVRTAFDLSKAATILLERGVTRVFIKGGHLTNFGDQYVYDYYADRSGLRFFVRNKRRPITNLRGTGCTFAAALAANLALGHETADAVVLARAYLNQCFDTALPFGTKTFLINHRDPNLNPSLMPQVIPQGRPESIPELEADWDQSPPHQTGFYVIADSAVWVERLVRWGVPTIQLRIKNLTGDVLSTEISRAVQAAQRSRSTLYINDYWREGLKAGAAGIHLGQEDLQSLNSADLRLIKSTGLRLGISTHSWYEAAVASTVRPSYIALGPVLPTTCKSMRFGPQGFKKLFQWKRAWGIPLVAIGGLTLDHAPALREAGCEGAAVISDILKASDPASRTAAWLEAFPNRQDF